MHVGAQNFNFFSPMHSDQQNEGEEVHSPRFMLGQPDTLFDSGVKDEYVRIFGMHSGFSESPKSMESYIPLNRLPYPTMANLETVEGLLLNPPFDRDSWLRDVEASVCALSEDGQFPWLLQLCLSFDVAVDCESELSLETLFEIVKSLFLNCTEVLLIRLVENDFVFESILGILVSDPEVSPDRRVNHMEYLLQEASSNKRFFSTDPDLIGKIKVCLRLNYIRESVLARMLDDYSLAVFTNTVQGLNSQIFSRLSGTGFVENAFLCAPNKLEFLLSVSNVASKQMLGGEERDRLFGELTNDAVLEYLETADPIGMDVLISLATHNPTAIRNRCVRRESFFRSIISNLHLCESESRAIQISEFVRLLLDPGDGELVCFFYEKGLLIHLGTGQWTNPFVCQHVFDLLAFCVVSHLGQARGYFLQFGSLLMPKIRHHLTSDSNRLTMLAAVRLVRAFIWQKDQMYLQMLTAHGLPGILLQLLATHRSSQNMVYSAVLEVLTFVCVNSLGFVMEILCRDRPTLMQLAHESEPKSHAELCQFMLANVQETTDYSESEHGESRQSITSSRARSVSPRLIRVPMPHKRAREEEESGDDEVIPKTPMRSPRGSPPDDIAPELAPGTPPVEGTVHTVKKMRFSNLARRYSDEQGPPS